MTAKKTLRERERELRALLTPEGHAQLREMAARHAERLGKRHGLAESLVAFILGCERESGLIGDD